MSVTNLAAGQSIGLIATLNSKLEKPLLQSEMGLDLAASALGQAVRWNEFSLKHNNDGTFKTGIIASADIGNGAVTSTNAPLLLKFADIITDIVISGTLPATSLTLSTTIPEQIAYIIGSRVDALAVTPTFTASTDTYVDLSNTGVYTYTAVANLAAAPVVAANSMRMFKFVTSATAITTVTDLRVLTLAIAKQSGILGSQLSTTAGIIGTQLSATAGVLGSQLSATANVLGSQLSATAGIVGSQLANHQNYKKSSIANPSATAATNGTAVVLVPPTGYVSMAPMACDVVFGGTFGVETVTANITVTFSDTLTASVTKTATAVGTASLTNQDLMALSKDAVYIKQISVVSQSSIAASAATVTFNHYGLYL